MRRDSLNKYKSIKYNFIMNFIRVLMTIVFPMITFPYASRVLTEYGLGKVTYVTTMVSYFQLIAAFGISNYAITEGAKIRNDRQKLNRFVSEMFYINLFTMVIAYIGFIIIFFFPHFKTYRYLLLISCTTIFFSTVGIEWLYELIEEYQYITIRSIIFQVVSLVLLFVFVKNSNDVAWYIGLTVFATAGSNILNFFHSKNYIKISIKGIRYTDIKKHLKPMTYMFGVSVASVIYLNSDITMLGTMKNNRDVGIYTAATKMNQVLCQLIKSISTVVLARLSFYKSNDNEDEYYNLLTNVFRFLILLIIPAMFGMYLLAPQIIMLISGERYMDAVPTVRILVLNLFLSPINGFIAYQVFMPIKKEKIIFWATCGGAVSNIIMNLFLIPYLSYNGAAMATVIAEGIVMLISVFLGKEYIKIENNGASEYVKMFISACPMVVFYVVLRKMVSMNFIIYTFIMVLCCSVTYFALLIILKEDIVYSEFVKILKEKRRKLR